MDRQILKDVIIDQHTIPLPDPLIEREIFSNIKHLKKSKQILIISGLRRTGKSTLLHLLQQDSHETDYFINFDEIQNIPQWERFIRRLHDQGHKIYITGSNAALLSVELGTRLTGRYIEINLYPYSYTEFLIYKRINWFATLNLTTVQKGLLKKEFNEFLTLGGLPEYIQSQQREYLHTLYESIIYRDIIVRYKISNPQAIKELVYYLASNIGKECSYNSLKKILGIASATTISDYCGYLENSFLCYFVYRFDYSLRKQLQYAKKVYFIDSALAINVGFRFSNDPGRLLENIIFIELKRQGYEIYFHHAKSECSFVLRDKTKIIAAIQISEQTFEINVIPIWKWLLQKNINEISEFMH